MKKGFLKLGREVDSNNSVNKGLYIKNKKRINNCGSINNLGG